MASNVRAKCDLSPLRCSDMEWHEARDGRIMRGLNRLRRFGEDSQKGIAMGVESVVSGEAHFLIGIWEDMGLQEILARDVGKRRHPSVGVVSEGTILRKEAGIKQVPNAPKENVVGEGVGLPSRSDGTYYASILSIAGHAH